MDAPAATTGGFVPLTPAAAGGRRHKLKLVTKKKARKVLKKLGLKIRGGADAAPNAAVALPAETVAAAKMGGADEMPEVPAAPAPAPAAGRRKTKKAKKSRRSIFGY